MSAYNKKLVAAVERYKLETGQTEVSSREVAKWMIAKGDWKQHPREPERLCARDISRALGEEYITDPQGRRVRSQHVAFIKRGAVSLPLWSDMTTGTREHFGLAVQQRRQRVVGDCRQLKADVDSYNDNFNPGREPIPLCLDFTDDVTEAML
jgi:hypothetical protein